MNRQILKTFTGKFTSKPEAMTDAARTSEDLIRLSQEMKSYLQEAAKDLLQPRPEAIAQLLKKSLVK